ncbi:transcriptional regulator, TetR family [Mycobacterium kansasii]|uniref:Transcriptional regulator, TetR family n=1 Tax=Mycobacterium kansasii TaxID=1768 RepID=A0A1V3X307_MYCKA|nr:transcriptional regulator, TetR family [Mycobacterium kansasii]
MRTSLIRALRSDCAAAIEKYWRTTLRRGLSKKEAADVMATLTLPQTYSMLTTDMGWSPDRYQKWLANALPQLLLRPELLCD